MQNSKISSFLLFLMVSLVACQGPETAGTIPDCCVTSRQILEGLPQCCQDNLGNPPEEWTGCCATGMVAGVADDARPACCATTLAARDSFPDCCEEVLFDGKQNACCANM